MIAARVAIALLALALMMLVAYIEHVDVITGAVTG